MAWKPPVPLAILSLMVLLFSNSAEGGTLRGIPFQAQNLIIKMRQRTFRLCVSHCECLTKESTGGRFYFRTPLDSPVLSILHQL